MKRKHPGIRQSGGRTLGLYIHPTEAPPTVAKASVASKTGQIHTIVTRHDDIPGPSSQAELVIPEDTMQIDQAFDPGFLDPHESAGDPASDFAGIRVTQPAKRYINSDHPLLTWIPVRDEYLDALLRLDGRGYFHEAGCASCGGVMPIYRCLDCHGRQVVCKPCLMRNHAHQPLHITEVWTGECFEKISLATLGLHVQLGHTARTRCQFPKAARKDLQVMHTNGIHSVNLDFCGCRGDYEHRQQMLDVAWYPATIVDPQTCATFTVLRQFHTLNLQGKISAYDFYKSILILTDSTGLDKIPNRLSSFMLMVREWRHLKAAKRAGRGHDPTRISGTSHGGFAVHCRACPQPNINLPQGWEKAPAEIAWLYTLILSEDANFRLKNVLRSSDDVDPSLGPGFAYFLKSDEYLEHLSKYIDEDEISHCVGFAALWLANSKKSKGLRATGVGSVSCSRHQFFRPNGTGDLQKGEKYSNMTYIMLSSLMGLFLVSLLLCYDIACQFSKNFWERLKDFPDHLQFINVPFLRWKVPKFHLPPHKIDCHGPFSLNYTSGVGRTDGEGVERNWAFLNRAAPSTSQMGPGSRHDTLDDFMGWWNYRRTTEFGEMLLKNIVNAIPQALVHRQAFHVFTDALRKNHLEELQSWEKMIRDWETGKSEEDPYLIKEDTVSVNEIRRQLAEEDHQRVEHGGVSLEVTPASFIISGLAIEDSQLSLRSEALKKDMTPAQQASLQQKRTSLLRKINKFREVQVTYMPGLSPPDDSTELPERMVIWLPSTLDGTQRSVVCGAFGLSDIEDRLREAHASEALGDLRRQLRTRTFARKFKDENASSQGTYTRMRTLQNQIEARIRSARDRYVAARKALFQLRGPGNWEDTYRVLTAEDIRSVNEKTVSQEEQDANTRACFAAGLEEGSDSNQTLHTVSTLRLRTGDGYNRLSWIWLNMSTQELLDDPDGSLHEGIRLEWLKAWARGERWREEVMLLDEEMRRVLEFCDWRARWWDAQSGRRVTGATALDEGLQAYAAEHAGIERSRAAGWSTKWNAVRQRAREVLQQKLDGVTGEVEGLYQEIEVILEPADSEGEEGWSDDD